MELEGVFNLPFVVSERKKKSQFSERERTINRGIYEAVKRARNVFRPISERSYSWAEALKLVVGKRFIQLGVLQNLRPAEYHEPLIDKSFIVDDRILESYSPELKRAVDEGKVDTEAAFAIMELFLRDNSRNLTTSQLLFLANLFPPRHPKVDFDYYKAGVEENPNGKVIPEKSIEDSWTMRREILDLLEITNLIKEKYLKDKNGKTIYITDLIKISADALRTVHQASSMIGIGQINNRDGLIIKSGEMPEYRRNKQEAILRALAHPGLMLALIACPAHGDVIKDAERLLNFPPNIQIEGQENVPATGPVIVAFSHMDRWRDPKIPVNWEMTKMVQVIQSRRQARDLNLVAYLSYVKETATWPFLRPIVSLAVNAVVKRLESRYGLHFIDVASSQEKAYGFMQDAKKALNTNQVVLIAPEGVPATEVIRPRRGMGTLARITHSPVVGVAFKEELLPDGKFAYKVIFTPAHHYDKNNLPGKTNKQKDFSFADEVMRDIALCLPESQRGIYR